MAAKVVKMKKKQNSKKVVAKRLPFLEISEVVHCFVMEYKIVERAPMIIYTKVGDRTIHAAWVHPETNLSALKKMLKYQKKNHDDIPMYISLWKEVYYGPGSPGNISQVVVRSIAETFDETIEMFRDPKTKAFIQFGVNKSQNVATR